MIIKYPNKILTTLSTNVDIKEGRKIANLLKKELADAPAGVGLAAPQIGLNKNIFSAMGIIYINPEITKYSFITNIAPEACLSIPGETFQVARAVSVVIKYTNMKGRGVIKIVNGFEARVIQHEYDHLQGKLINQ